MLFVIRFVDKPDKPEIRKRFLEAHIEWLSQRGQSILLAGSVRDEPEKNPLGGIWVVEAESKADAEKMFNTDPFWTNGLRKSFEILHFSKAFPNAQSII